MRAVSERVSDACRWLWDRRFEAVAGALVIAATIAASAVRPGPWWAH